MHATDNACELEIMTISKRAKIVSVVVISETYYACIVFFFSFWRPISTI